MINLRKKVKVFLVFAAVALCAAALLTMSEEVTTGAREALSVCGGVLIPSLFPFLALSAFLASPGISQVLGRVFGPLTRRIFALPGECGGVILLAAVGGFPVGARMAAELLENGRITQEQARRLMRFCVNPGPAFLVTAVGTLMLGSRRAGFLLFAATTISMLLMGIVQGAFSRESREVALRTGRRKDGEGDGDYALALTSAVGAAVNGMLSICAWMVLFTCLVSVLGSLLGSGTARELLLLFGEVTAGVRFASHSGNVALVAAVAGFGGFCVHAQVLPGLLRAGLRYREFFLWRVCGGMLSFAAAKVLLLVFPFEIAKETALQFSYEVFSVSVPATLALLLLCAVLICANSIGEDVQVRGRRV